MASRYYNQFMFSHNVGLTFIEGSFRIGASGAVSPSTGIVGTGVQTVTRGGTGQYQVTLTDNFNRLVGTDFVVFSPTSSGASVTDGSFVTGVPYQIVFPSTSTNWTVVGLPAGLTAAQGMPFVASSGASNGGTSGVAGVGTAIRVIPSGVASIEVIPNSNLELYNSTSSGANIYLQTLNTSNAAANPTSGAVIRFGFTLRNSSRTGSNELPTNY